MDRLCAPGVFTHSFLSLSRFLLWTSCDIRATIKTVRGSAEVFGGITIAAWHREIDYIPWRVAGRCFRGWRSGVTFFQPGCRYGRRREGGSSERHCRDARPSRLGPNGQHAPFPTARMRGRNVACRFPVTGPPAQVGDAASGFRPSHRMRRRETDASAGPVPGAGADEGTAIASCRLPSVASLYLTGCGTVLRRRARTPRQETECCRRGAQAGCT